MSLPETLEHAATELASLADQIRPANGDPDRLLEELKPEEAAALLVWVLEHEPGSGAELVEAWGESEAGAAVLLGLSDEGLSKVGRKLLRKARHRLRSRGLEVVAVEPAATPGRRLVKADDPFEAAYLSTPDFRGARVGYLAGRHPAGGARLFEIRFDEARGILDFKVYNAGRSKVRGFLRSLAGARARQLFDVPATALCALIRRASLAQPSDRPLPTGFVEWRGRLFSEALEKEATPGALARAALASGLDSINLEQALADVSKSIAEGEAGPWPPATRWVSEWMDKGRGAVEDLEGEARDAAIESWLEEVSADLAERLDRSLLTRHLEELAWARWQADEADLARSLIRVADAVANDAEVHRRLARTRAESLFAPFVSDLRPGEPDDESADESAEGVVDEAIASGAAAPDAE